MDPIPIEGYDDLYVLDVDMYDATRYGGVYILGSDRPAIIETGIGMRVDRILAGVEAVGIAPEDVERIAVTHVHLDHAGGAGYLIDACENATVSVHKRGAPHLADPERLIAGTKAAVGDQWQYYAEPRPIPEHRIQSVRDGDEIDLGDRHLTVREAPGHASHQVIFHDQDAGVVFTGDAAGIWIPSEQRLTVTSPPPEFDLEQAISDVDRIIDLEPEILCYTHFGAVPASEELLTGYQQQLKEWVEQIATARSNHDTDSALIEQYVENTAIVEEWGREKSRAETRLNATGALRYVTKRGED